MIPSGSSATETVPAPAAAFSNSPTFASNPGYEINQFFGSELFPRKTFTDESFILSRLASPSTSKPE